MEKTSQLFSRPVCGAATDGHPSPRPNGRFQLLFTFGPSGLRPPDWRWLCAEHFAQDNSRLSRREDPKVACLARTLRKHGIAQVGEQF